MTKTNDINMEKHSHRMTKTAHNQNGINRFDYWTLFFSFFAAKIVYEKKKYHIIIITAICSVFSSAIHNGNATVNCEFVRWLFY